MSAKPPASDPVQDAPEVSAPKESAVGLPGDHPRPARRPAADGRAAHRAHPAALNQPDGFDCPGCAWPEPEQTAPRRVLRERRQGGGRGGHRRAASTARLLRRAPGRRAGRAAATTGWASRAGSPSRWSSGPGADHYEPDRAGTTPSTLVAAELRGAGLARRGRLLHVGPHQQRGRLPLPAVRPRASAPTTCPTARTCATSRAASRSARPSAWARARCTLEDISSRPTCILVVGQNPGTNHPRMLTALEEAKDDGARIVAINPLPEAGLLRFKNPQTPARRWSAAAPAWPTCFLQIRVNGDLALFQAARTSCCSSDAARRRARPRLHRRAHRRLRRAAPPHAARPRLGRRRWRATGLDRGPRSSELATRSLAAERIIVCWAMGLTQHRNSVRHHPRGRQLPAAAGQHRPPRRRRLPGAGPQQRAGRPHHGHLREAGAGVPRRPRRRVRLRRRRASTATTPSTPSGPCATATATVFVAMGGNFVAAAPDTDAHRGGPAPLPAHRAGVHQAEPLARRAPATSR